MGRLVVWALAPLAALAMAASAHAADITVTTTADLIAADGQCSLREAVTAARDDAAYQGCPAGAGTDTIVLDAQPYALSLAGRGEGANATGDLDTGVQALRVVGRGSGATAIDAAGIDRALEVPEDASLALEDLTVRNGLGGPGDPGEQGGAVLSMGSLSALRVAFAGNSAGAGSSGATVGSGGAGGAISFRPGGAGAATLTVVDSSFIGNRAGRGGDGAAANNGGDGGRGGAIEAIGGTLAISGTTFSANLSGNGGDGGPGPPTPGPGGTGGQGGAIYLGGGTMTITTSTFATNRAGAGGLTGGNGAPARGGRSGAVAVESTATASAAYSTFSDNLRGPNPFPEDANGLDDVRVEASILADAAPACQAVTAGPLRNIALPGDPSCPGPRLDGDPRLGPLGANSGPTLTLLPGPGSAAIDALAGAACPATDQRGLPRPRLGGCDAGAVEVQPPPAGAATAPRTTAAAARARRLSGLRLSPSSFRAAGAGGSIGALAKALQQRRPVGTTVRYTLDGAARVTFTITKKVAGRRVGRRCVKPAAARPGARRCLRTQGLKGSFAHQGTAGQNSFRFTGRLRRKALALGPYRLVARLPRPAPGRAALASTAFRIVR